MDKKIIVIDGKTYKSVDEMPEDVRRNYENAMNQLDKDRNGMPDLLENFDAFADKNKDGMPDAFEGVAQDIVTSSTKIIVNGKVYDSLDDLPPDIRARYDLAMAKLDANRNGVPDFLEGMLNASGQADNIAGRFGTQTPRSPDFAQDKPSRIAQSNSFPNNSTMEPISSSGWMLALAIVLLLGLCAVGALGVWYLLFR